MTAINTAINTMGVRLVIIVTEVPEEISAEVKAIDK